MAQNTDAHTGAHVAHAIHVACMAGRQFIMGLSGSDDPKFGSFDPKPIDPQGTCTRDHVLRGYNSTLAQTDQHAPYPHQQQQQKHALHDYMHLTQLPPMHTRKPHRFACSACSSTAGWGEGCGQTANNLSYPFLVSSSFVHRPLRACSAEHAPPVIIVIIGTWRPPWPH